jgi:hypothetical protein
MSDSVVRELERAVEREGSAAARVKLAAELERLERIDDAVVALMKATESPEARKTLLRLRSINVGWWTNFFDVRPIARTPRIRWQHALADFELKSRFVSLGATPSLIATPVGIVVGHLPGPLEVLDPDSGKLLWSAAGEGRIADVYLRAAGPLLFRVSLRLGVRAWDLASREPLEHVTSEHPDFGFWLARAMASPAAGKTWINSRREGPLARFAGVVDWTANPRSPTFDFSVGNGGDVPPGHEVTVEDARTRAKLFVLPTCCDNPVIVRDTIYHLHVPAEPRRTILQAYERAGLVWQVELPSELANPRAVLGPLDDRVVVASATHVALLG